MLKVVGRSGNLAGLLKTTSSAGASSVIPLVNAQPVQDEKPRLLLPVPLTGYTAATFLPIGKLKVKCGPCGPTVIQSVRYGHTDMKVPDFTPYRKSSCKDPTSRARDSHIERKMFTYTMLGIGGAATLYAAKATVTAIVMSMAPSADVLALAKIEIDLKNIPEGKNVTFKWRGKPLFVRHRTPEEISKEGQVDVSSLRHPEHDRDRARIPEWLVVIGVCTHLGCVPISHQGDWGGYYCPCHGSHYDAAGRIRKGPAPLNLEIPPHEFLEDGMLVVG